MNGKQRVYATLDGECKGRAPRQLWTLPWAHIYHNDEVVKILTDYPEDIGYVPAILKEPFVKLRGNSTEIGEYVDEYGCVFTNIQRGVIGEVKHPIVNEDDWSDSSNVHLPYELLSFDIAQVNEYCRAHSDQFNIAGFTARPFEQLQFIRGTENLYCDLMDMPKGLRDFIARFHAFYCEVLEKWAKTDVDSLNMMDDWGTQRSLLISPDLWREIFKPLYRDYIDIAHRHGKRIFMHSDGYTKDIIPDLIELGLDAFNTQIFCMGPENLTEFKGKITFWGEIDRQNLLPYGTPEDIDRAVKTVVDNLWDNGHCIAQCEFGAGANPHNVYEVYKAWDKYTK